MNAHSADKIKVVSADRYRERIAGSLVNIYLRGSIYLQIRIRTTNIKPTKIVLINIFTYLQAYFIFFPDWSIRIFRSNNNGFNRVILYIVWSKVNHSVQGWIYHLNIDSPTGIHLR